MGNGKSLATNNTKVINELHRIAIGVTTEAKNNIVCAWAAVGEKLVEQKEKTPHGHWIPWVEANLTFGRNQAARYMRVYRHKDALLSVEVGSLAHALMEIAPPKECLPEDVVDEDTLEGDVEEVVESDEKDLKIKELTSQLENAEAIIQEFEADDSEGEYQKLYEKALEENQKLKTQGIETEKDVASRVVTLKKDRDKLQKEISGFKGLVVLVQNTREFFSKQLALIPTLNLSQSTLKKSKSDAMAIIEVVEKWTVAMREKFDV